MNWVYLSPHFDDIALSCGGLVWEQAQAGESVSIWTICAGNPPPGALSPFAQSLHTRWQFSDQAVEQRRLEDIAACQRLSASYVHFPVPDCIYRRSGEWSESLPLQDDTLLYASDEAIMGPIHPSEAGLVQQLSADFARRLPSQDQLVCPLSLGGHVDHRLTRATAEALGRKLCYYADYPYVLDYPQELEALKEDGWQSFHFAVTDAGLAAWGLAIAEFKSQISTFWPDLQAMYVAVQAYRDASSGLLLWQPPDHG